MTNGRVRGIGWILFQFDHISAFVLRTPLSSEVPVVLLNQPINYFRDLTQQDGWKTQDDRITKKCRATPEMHSLAQHFLVILLSWVFQSSCCVGSLIYTHKWTVLLALANWLARRWLYTPRCRWKTVDIYLAASLHLSEWLLIKNL